MQNIFFIADLHLGHKNIIDYEKRPFSSTDNMNKSIIKNWNSVVTNKDKVLVAGDVSFLDKDETKKVIDQMNGYKILIMGNHDRGRSIQWWYDVGFNEVSKHPILFQDFILVSHEPPTYIPPLTPYFYIYGHVHSSEMYKTVTATSCCVSVERWNYTPVNLKEILELVKYYRTIDLVGDRLPIFKRHGG